MPKKEHSTAGFFIGAGVAVLIAIVMIATGVKRNDDGPSKELALRPLTEATATPDSCDDACLSRKLYVLQLSREHQGEFKAVASGDSLSIVADNVAMGDDQAYLAAMILSSKNIVKDACKAGFAYVRVTGEHFPGSAPDQPLPCKTKKVHSHS